MKLDGTINAQDLSITAGANRYDYVSRSVTGAVPGAGTTPAYAIDSTALGGMYANRIRLTATEAGVGVRMLGDAAASADDFTLSAAGRIELQNRISAQRDVLVASTSNEATALALSNASLSSGRDTSLTATGGVSLNGNAIVAASNLAVNAASLIDNASSAALQNNNVRSAGGTLQLTIGGGANVTGTQWVAAGNWQGVFGALTTGAGTRFQSSGKLEASTTSGDMNLGPAALQASGDLLLTTVGKLSVAKDAAQGIESLGGNVVLTAAQGLNNAGTITADKGAATLRVDGAIDNSGTVHAATTLDIADRNGTGTQSLTNSGNLLADRDLALKAAAIRNTSTGWMQADAGSRIDAGSLDNAGAVLLSQQSTANDTITLSGDLTNSGTLQSKGNATLSAHDVTNARTLLATNALAIHATGSVTNAANAITQAKSVDIKAANSIANAAAATLRADTVALTAGTGLTNNGLISADHGAAMLRASGTLTNTGTLQASQTLDIADAHGGATEAINNTGVMLSDGTIAMQAASITNATNGGDPQTGWIQANAGTTIQAGSLDNRATWLLSQQTTANDSVTLSGDLTNSGALQSKGNAAVSARDVNNSGALYASNNLGITAAGNVANTGNGVLQAGQTLGVTAAGSLTNRDATSAIKAANVNLTATGLTNGGIVSADTGTATLRVDGTVTNTGTVNAGSKLDIADRSGNGSENVDNSGYLLSDGTLALKAGAITNAPAPGDAQSGWVQAKAGSNITAASLDNNGTWLLSMQAGSIVSLTLTGTLTNNGTLQANQDATLQMARLVNQANAALRAGRDLTLLLGTGTALTNAGTIQAAAGTLGITANGATLANSSGGKLLGDKLSLTADTLNNAGTIQGGSNAASTITLTGTFLNDTGGVTTLAATSGGAGTVTANQITNKGTLQSVGNMSLAVGTGGLNTTGSLLSNGALNIGARGANNYTAALNGTVQAGGKLSVQQGTGNSTLSIGSGKTVSGGTVDIDMNTVTLNKDAVLSSGGNLDLDAATLTLGGDTTSTARVMAAMGGAGGTGNITVRNDLTNDGLLYSRDALNVTAPNITNSGTGGIAALGDVTVKANAGTLTLAGGPNAGAGNLVNNGAIYAGRNLSVTANGTLTNSSTINAVGAMTLRANTVVNNRDIVSDGSIDIVANTIRNEVAGGDTRYWTTSATVTNKYGGEYDDGDAGGNLDEFQDYKATWTEYQRYRDDQAPTYSPQILATTNLKLTFHTGSNLGGTIYGGSSVALQGFSVDGTQTNPNALRDRGIYDDAGHGFKLGGDATFTNDNLALQTKDYTRYYTLHTKYIALGPAKKYSNELCEGDHYDSGCHFGSGYSDSFAYSENNQIKAGIYTTTLTANGIALTNKGAVTTDVNSAKEGTTKPNTIGTAIKGNTNGVGSTTLNGTTSGVNDQSGKTATTVGGVTVKGGVSFVAGNVANGVNGTSFGGINIPLPTNPNGFFVMARDPGAKYLVETNPLYMGGTATYGSDYLTKMLGYSTDEIGLRLGDASYENYLVKQQLIAQTGNVMLASYGNADAQMQGLFDNASAQTKSLGLELGKALMPEQQANLKQDIVWMVQTVVDGRTVLAPVVYLSQSTKAAVSSGAVISAQDANLNLTSLTNTGGTIVGGKSLVVTSTGDITNTSGVIKGGNVSLTSTEGSIVNKTFSTSNGTTDLFQQTTVGQTGSIQSTGTLALDAKKDIRNLGATMTAGTDASLKAGNNITFDTIENKNTSTTGTNRGPEGAKGITTTTTTTVEQVKSGLTVGGNLSAQAGNDITLAGTDAKVGGNADLNAGNNVNIVARENTTTTHTTSISSGFGNNNSVYGSTKVTSDSTSVRNVGSNLQVGGNANVTAKNDVTVQGSNVDVKGNGQINATNVNVLAGRNYDETHTTTERSGILQVSASGNRSASAEASASSASGRGSAAAAAGASAEANGNGSAGLAFSSTTKTQTDTTDLRHVGSNVSFGGNATINATQDVNLQGSNVKAGGNATVNAQNVNLLAAEDKKTSNTTSTTTTVGLMASSNNKAEAQAEASAGAAAGKGNPNAAANASASASANSENHLDFVQHSTSTSSSLDTTHQGSGISAGGDLNVKATNGLTLEGSQLASGGNMNLDAKDMNFKAVNDVHETRSSSSTTTAGLYASGNASAETKAGAGVGLGAQAGASAEASARGEVGLYGSNTRTSNVDGSTTAVTSGISAGGNITRTATNSINDVGTQISAGGNLTQSAQTITSQAAANTTYSSSSSTTDTAKLGAYAEASASASVSANAGAGAGKPSSTETSAGAGITASYQHDATAATSNTSNAVVSNIKVGGNVTSTSTNATTLEGTTIDAGKNVSLNAGSLDYRAAANTSSSTSNSTSAGGKVDVDIVNKSVGVGASYQGDKASDSSSTAVVGGINAGGNLSINTKGDTRLEGTNIAAADGASVTTGGKLTFDAAKNTSSSSSQSVGVEVGVTAGKGEGSAEVGVGVGKASSSGNTDVAGSISGGSGPLSIKSGGDATFTGTSLSSGGDVTVNAGGNLAFNAARDKQTSQSTTVDVSAAASGGKKENVGGTKGSNGQKTGGKTMDERSGEASVGVGVQNSQSDIATASSISSGGNIKLTSGGNTTLEGTQGSAKGSVAVVAGGTVTQKDAVSTSSSTDVSVSASAAGSSLSSPTKKGGTSKGGTSGSGTGTGTGGGGTGSGSGSTGSTGNTGSGGGTSNAGNTGGTGGTSNTGNTGNTGKTGSTKPRDPYAQQKGSGVANVGVDVQSSTTAQKTSLTGGNGVTVTSGQK
ncbi:hemagglutinin repeat-containing protein [Cupriavidus pampae]|uniref:hemagglutinin repeat-containing protein n=1 Tax=Cupriavidus pampae TaxID=659251 RepID=UPI0036182DC1